MSRIITVGAWQGFNEAPANSPGRALTANEPGTGVSALQ